LTFKIHKSTRKQVKAEGTKEQHIQLVETLVISKVMIALLSSLSSPTPPVFLCGCLQALTLRQVCHVALHVPGFE
jgi:hypothetical protein